MKISLSLLLRCLMVAVPLFLTVSMARAQRGYDISYTKLPGSTHSYLINYTRFLTDCPGAFTPNPNHSNLRIDQGCGNQTIFRTLPFDTLTEATNFCPAAVTYCDNAGSPLRSVYARVFSDTVN